jgi:tRNA(Ile)-lysidine synthase
LPSTLPSGPPAGALVVAFSGGPDSLALLLAASRLSRRSLLRLHAAHLDHALDSGSAARAAAAAALAEKLGVPFLCRRLADEGPQKESREAYARRARYRFLEEAARDTGATWVMTAHHADDQAETVLLRLLFGSGLEGLGGIAAQRQLGPSALLLRPLLGLRRAELREAAAAAGLEPIDDPTNGDLRVPRNRVRHLLLPRLAEEAGGGLVELLCKVAAAGRPAAAHLAGRLALFLGAEKTAAGARLSRNEFERLPVILHGPALSLLHRLAGEAQPAPAEARAELVRQLRRGGKVRCDCGGRRGRNFWWQADRYTLELRRAGGPEPLAAGFTYTFEASGARRRGKAEGS